MTDPKTAFMELGRFVATLAAIALAMKMLGVATKDDLTEVRFQAEQTRHYLEVVTAVYEAREHRNVFLWDDEPDTTGVRN